MIPRSDRPCCFRATKFGVPFGLPANEVSERWDVAPSVFPPSPHILSGLINRYSLETPTVSLFWDERCPESAFFFGDYLISYNLTAWRPLVVFV